MKIFRLILPLMITLWYSTSKAEPTQDQIIIITNVNVWDGIGNSLKNNYQVLIVGNHIKQVAPRVTIPSGAKIIDGKGNTLIPGL